MYKLLLTTDHPTVRELFETGIDFETLGFSKPIVVQTPEEAIDALKSKAVDACGFYLKNVDADPLLSFLQTERPTLPIFTVYAQKQKQLDVLKELQTLLDRLHLDFADEVYDEEAMMDIVREELVHSLLAGDIEKKEVVERWLQLIRSNIDPKKACILFELDMPQGEIYLSDRWHHGMERLENALRKNFFNRYQEDVYYGVAVLTNRHIRVVAIPNKELKVTKAALNKTAKAHVLDTIEYIKEYLDLDINVQEVGAVASLLDFVVEK